MFLSLEENENLYVTWEYSFKNKMADSKVCNNMYVSKFRKLKYTTDTFISWFVTSRLWTHPNNYSNTPVYYQHTLESVLPVQHAPKCYQSNTLMTVYYQFNMLQSVTSPTHSWQCVTSSTRSKVLPVQHTLESVLPVQHAPKCYKSNTLMTVCYQFNTLQSVTSPTYWWQCVTSSTHSKVLPVQHTDDSVLPVQHTPKCYQSNTLWIVCYQSNNSSSPTSASMYTVVSSTSSGSISWLVSSATVLRFSARSLGLPWEFDGRPESTLSISQGSWPQDAESDTLTEELASSGTTLAVDDVSSWILSTNGVKWDWCQKPADPLQHVFHCFVCQDAVLNVMGVRHFEIVTKILCNKNKGQDWVIKSNSWERLIWVISVTLVRHRVFYGELRDLLHNLNFTSDWNRNSHWFGSNVM